MKLPRRRVLAFPAVGLAASAAMARPAAAGSADVPESEEMAVRYCLNTSTVRGQELSVPDQIDLAADAGYDGIEPWIGDLRKYVEAGGDAAELRKRLEDRGLLVESAIGFARWIVDDDAERQAGLEEMRRDMALLRSIGGTRIAAPPVGAHQQAGPDLPTVAERYRRLLELGREEGVLPQLELWGPSKTLSRLGELAFVAAEAGHPDACVLPDVYHIYKGGSDFAGLGMLNASRIHVFHMNDYPADPPRDAIADRDRVYPGDGIAPLDQILQTLRAGGFRGALSLELFNPAYWQQDAKLVARTGLEKMRAAVASAAARS